VLRGARRVDDVDVTALALLDGGAQSGEGLIALDLVLLLHDVELVRHEITRHVLRPELGGEVV
jgi:hypothetical protein